jgi:biuret amidohydrolase
MPAYICKADPGAFEFQLETTALLIVDMQRDFLEKGGFGDLMGYDITRMEGVIRQCRLALQAAREAGMFIVHTREGFRPDLTDAAPIKLTRIYNDIGVGDRGPLGRVLVRGEPGHDIIPELYPRPGEPVIDKVGHGAFYATDLELIFKNQGIKSLIICGVVTEVCVHSTLREAKDHGYACLVLEDCVGSYSEEFHRVSIDIVKTQGGLFGKVSSLAELLRALDDA